MDTQKLVAKLRAKHSKLSGGGGSDVNFVKFDTGKNRFRLVDSNTGPMLIFYKRHRGARANGNFFAPIDLNWLNSDNECKEEMLDRGVLSRYDIDMIHKYGDPYSVLYKALESIDREKDFINARIGQKRSLCTVFFNGEFGVLDMGITFGDHLLGMLEDNPVIISWEKGFDLSCTKTTGKHWSQTSYSSPSIIIDSQGPIDFDVEGDNKPTTPNLYDVIQMNTLGYLEKVAFLLRSNEALVETAGLEPEDFGVTEEDLNSIVQEAAEEEKEKKDFPYGDNKEKEEDDEVEDNDEDEEELDLDFLEDDEEEEDNEED